MTTLCLITLTTTKPVAEGFAPDDPPRRRDTGRLASYRRERLDGGRVACEAGDGSGVRVRGRDDGVERTMKTETFELKLSNGKTVTWTGTSGEHAARSYVSVHPSETVIAWRYPRHELKIGMIKITQ